MYCCYDNPHGNNVESWDWFNRTWSKFKNWISDTADIIRDVAPEFKALVPFKGALERGIESRGISVPENFNDLVGTFYGTFVKNNYSSFDISEIAENNPELMQAIATAVMSYVLSLIEKKDRGEPMTPVEEKIANTADNVSDKIRDYSKNEIQNEIMRYLPWVLVVGIGAFLMFKMKK